jgi:hypothetical protein
MIPVLEEGISYRPDNAWLRNMYGLALLNTDRKEEALVQFTRTRELAALLTEEEWGRSYPGNDPAVWGNGLSEFREIIEKNIVLAEK